MQDSCTMLLGMDEHGNATQTASRGRSGVNLMRCVIQIPWSARNKSNSKFCLEYILVFDLSKKYNCCGQIWISLKYIDDFFSSLRAITIWFYLILVSHDFFQEVPQAAIPTMHSGSKRKSDTCHSIEAQHEANAKVGNDSKYYESLRNVLPNDGSSHWIIRFTVFYSCLVLDKVTHETSEGTTVRCHYNAVNFLTNIQKRHPISRPLGRSMGVFCGSNIWLIFYLSMGVFCGSNIWLIFYLSFLQLFMQYLIILNRVITVLDCMKNK